MTGARGRVPIATLAREWTRIGVTGFGGPPARIALQRQLMVERTRWMDAQAFQDANAACGLLPGPASTQLAIFCAYQVGGPRGAIIGGLGFFTPAVILILILSVLFLAQSPPCGSEAPGREPGPRAPPSLVHTARGLFGPSVARVRHDVARTVRWLSYLAVGAVAAAWLGAYVVLVLLSCGLIELWSCADGRI